MDTRVLGPVRWLNGLCKQLNWEMLNGGQVFRNTAAEKGMALEAFGQYCIDDDSVDKELDQMLTMPCYRRTVHRLLKAV